MIVATVTMEDMQENEHAISEACAKWREDSGKDGGYVLFISEDPLTRCITIEDVTT